MLKPTYASLLSAQDQQVFDALVPADHYLRQVLTVVDFERFRSLMAPCYHATDGRPANDPVVLLKLCYLQTHYGLSDRAVIAHAQVNIAFRYVLALALTDYGHPTGNSASRDHICMTSESAACAHKRRLGLAVRLRDTPAVRTGSRGITRINGMDRNTHQCGLIDDKGPQLGKRPAMEGCAL